MTVHFIKYKLKYNNVLTKCLCICPMFICALSYVTTYFIHQYKFRLSLATQFSGEN